GSGSSMIPISEVGPSEILAGWGGGVGTCNQSSSLKAAKGARLFESESKEGITGTPGPGRVIRTRCSVTISASRLRLPVLLDPASTGFLYSNDIRAGLAGERNETEGNASFLPLFATSMRSTGTGFDRDARCGAFNCANTTYPVASPIAKATAATRR